MNPAAHVIQKLGGPRKVAEILGITLPRVYRFTYPKERGGTCGIIPHRHAATLLAAAPSLGVDLSPADFFASDPGNEEGRAA